MSFLSYAQTSGYRPKLDKRGIRYFLAGMKAMLAGSLLVCCAGVALAQNPTKAAQTGAGTRQTNAPAGKLTNAPPTSATNDVPAKPDIKDLIKLDAFTNDTGMVMVKVSPKYWVGKFEVTQEEYQKIMGNNPSEFSGNRNPVDTVSWTDAQSFCARLNDAERKAEMLPEGCAYSLPTQAQWESYMDAAELADSIISAAGAMRTSTAPVGSLKPNTLGLYDTRGNVWEWCLDPQDQPYRVLRGAAWNSWIDINLRPEFRWYSDGPDDKKNTFGFRCVLQTATGK